MRPRPWRRRKGIRVNAYITSKSGLLFAECGELETCLNDWGLEGRYGFGESVALPEVPQDEFELVDMLMGAWGK